MCASRVSFCVAYARYTEQHQYYFSMLSEKYERQEDMLYYM